MDFKEIGKPKNHVLFISPTDYFGTNGWKLYTDTLIEAFWLIDTPDFDDMYIRFQATFRNGSRILFEPVETETDTRPIYAANDYKYVDRILDAMHNLNIECNKKLEEIKK